MAAELREWPSDIVAEPSFAETPLAEAGDTMAGKAALAGSVVVEPTSAMYRRAVGTVLEQSLRAPSPTGDMNVGGVTAFDAVD